MRGRVDALGSDEVVNTGEALDVDVAEKPTQDCSLDCLFLVREVAVAEINRELSCAENLPVD